MKYVKVTTVSDLTTGETINMYQEDVELSYTPSSGIHNNEEANEQILTEYYTPEVW